MNEIFCEWLWRCGSGASCPRWKRSIVTDRQLGWAPTAYRLNPTTPARLQPPLIGFPVAQVLVLLRFNESRLIGTDATPKWVNTWAHPSTFSPLCSTLKSSHRRQPPTRYRWNRKQSNQRPIVSTILHVRSSVPLTALLYSCQIENVIQPGTHTFWNETPELFVTPKFTPHHVLDPRRCCFIKLI